jgi:DNA-binding XRE family transcriptional regulator/predicted RNase H-like HicB family nuclease
MLYPIFICTDSGLGTYTAILPDFENCSTTVSDPKHLGQSVQKRIDLLLTDLAINLPVPSSIEDLKKKKKYRGGSWMQVDVDLSKWNAPTRLNISLPRRLVGQIDAAAELRGMSRSAFLAYGAQLVFASEEHLSLVAAEKESNAKRSAIARNGKVPREVTRRIADGVPPLRAWREHLGLTQQDVATRLGAGKSTYAAQENSTRLREKTVERIAKALGINSQQLNPY